MTAMNDSGRIVQLNSSPGGIPKRSRTSATLTPRGLEGDDWAHPQYHGGPDQALLLIGLEVLDELKSLGFNLYPGALGENLTTAGLDYLSLASGQRYRLGATSLIELTKLRTPCRTLDIYNSAAAGRIQKLLKENARGGWYARALSGGPLFPADPIRFESQLA